MRRHYFVLLVDVIDSSKLKDRQSLSVSLGEALVRLNQDFTESLYAPFEITRGDEVAAVLTTAKPLYAMCRVLNNFLHPVKYRLVLNYGELCAGLETRHSPIIDGPAFSKAEQMMHALKRSRRFVSLRTRAAHIDPVLQSQLDLLLWHWAGLTPLQQRILSLYLDERNQQRVAARLGRSQQQVQQTLSRCGWEIIAEAEKQAGRLLALMQRAH